MTDETKTPTDTSPAAQAPASEETVTELGLQDLVALKSIVDVASSRGAFKPNEMVAVGTVYSKLEKFLDNAMKQSQAAQQAATNA
jgi:hypothetical protein